MTTNKRADSNRSKAAKEESVRRRTVRNANSRFGFRVGVTA